MNINLKFENVVWQKKIGYVFLLIGLCLVIGISAIVISVLFKHYDNQLVNAKDQANLVSISVEEEIENITDSLLFISNLISDEDMRSKMSSSQVTNLLNELISKDEKIFGAFVMLDKTEYEEINEITDEIDFVSSDKEADEALEMLEENETIKDEDDERDFIVKEGNIQEGVNKFIYKSNGSTFETNLDRLKTLDYKKSYMKVMLTKTPQMTKPLKNTYNGVEVTTCTYTVPIVINGYFEGVIGIDIDVNKMREEISSKCQSLASEFVVIDKQGNIISSSNKSLTNVSVSELFKGNSNKKVLEYINDNIESGIMSSYNAGSSDMLHDKYLVMIPVMIEDNHMWNILFISYVDKVITNSIATIILVSIINVVLFGLFVFVLWLSFGTIINKKYGSLFNKVEGELTKIKASSTRIMEDIEDLEEIEIEDLTEEELEDVDEKVQKALREKDEQLEKLAEEEKAKENLNDPEPELVKETPAVDQTKIVNEDDPSLAFGAPEPAKEEPAVDQSKIVNEDDPSLAFGAPEAPAEAPAEEVTQPDFDAEAFKKAQEEEQAKLAAAEQEKEPEREAVKIDINNPAEGANGEKLSAMDQLKSAKVDTEGLDEILDNKDGSIENNSIVDEMAAKMEAAMAKENGEEAPTPAEEKPAEAPAPEPAPAPAPEPAPAPAEPEAPAEAPAPAPAPAPTQEQAAAPEAPAEHVDTPEELEAKKAKLAELQKKVAEKMQKEKEVYTVKVSHDDPDDLFGGAQRDRKLTNKEMDDLLKELEEKRRYEAEEMGMVAEEIDVADKSLSDLLGGMTSDDM